MPQDSYDGVKIVGEESHENDPITNFGKVFRVLFYIFLLFLVWRFLPFSFEELDFKGVSEMIGTLLLTVSILYSLFSPEPDEYHAWGTFGIWFLIGLGALYGVSFIL